MRLVHHAGALSVFRALLPLRLSFPSSFSVLFFLRHYSLPKVMADVEKDAESGHNGARKDAEIARDQDASSKSDMETILGPGDEITWRYLTFETPLPSPAHVSRPSTDPNDRSSPPECPDLKKYSNPFLWPERRKSAMTWLSVVATTFTAYTAGSYAPANERYMEMWHISEPAAQVGITVFTCGFGAAPMFLAPFSEINGRRPVFVITGFLFVIFQMACGLTHSFAGMLVFRFIVGCMGSTFSTMVGGVVSDIYHAKDRNTAMALFSGGALFGTGLGPLVSGFIAQYTTWRWIFYLQIITNGLIWVYIFFFFYETRGSILLSKKARRLNKWYDQLEAAGYYGVIMPTEKSSPREKAGQSSPQRIRWKVKADEERSSIAKMVSISLYRPFHLLVTEPVVFFFSLWISFAWSVLYLTFSAIPLVYRTNHNFNTAETGAVFASISIATIVSTIINVYQERVARRFFSAKRQEFLSTPEGRLYFSCIQSALLPIGLFWFGWVGADSMTPIIHNRTNRACSFADTLPLHPVDRIHPWHRLRYYGHPQHLPRRLQLPCRHLPPMGQLSARRPKLLPQHDGRRLSRVHGRHVPRNDISRRIELPRRHCSVADHRAVGSCLLRVED